MKITASGFKMFTGTVYVVVKKLQPDVAQGVFQNATSAHRLWNRMRKNGVRAEVFSGKFIDENTVETG